MPQECEQALEEELPGVGVEVELVLMTQWRLVADGKEERLGFGSLGSELAGEELRVGPQRIGVVGLAGCAVAGGGVEGMPAVCRPQRPVEALDGARLATSPGAAGAQAMTIGRAGAAGRGGDLPVRRCRAVRRSQ